TLRSHLAIAARCMSGILRHSDARRALDIYDHALRDLSDTAGDAHLEPYKVQLLAGARYPLRRLGRPAEARKRLDSAFQLLKDLKFYPGGKVEPDSEADETLCALADYEADTGNLARAIEIYQEVLDRTASLGAKPETILRHAVQLS